MSNSQNIKKSTSSSEENNKNKVFPNNDDDSDCVICEEPNIYPAPLPCGHCCICISCVKHLQNNICPCCKEPFEIKDKKFIPVDDFAGEEDVFSDVELEEGEDSSDYHMYT